MKRRQCSANIDCLAARSAVGDLGRTVFLTSRHVLDARHIEETFSHEQDHRFAARKPHEEPCKAAYVGELLDVGAGAAHACSCDPISPAAGFDRAQYVFAGKVVKAETHTWQIEVERVWKGHEKLGRTVRLMDVYATIDCEFFFQLGQRYLFFAILAKGGRNVFYHPQVCNWTRPLQSTRVPAEGNESLWLEDLIAHDHGPGEPPRDEQR